VRWVTLIIAALLVLVQADLWFGKGNLPYVMSLRKTLAIEREENTSVRERNTRTAAEVADLRDGLEMVEEKARSELGMIKRNEILVQVSASRP